VRGEVQRQQVPLLEAREVIHARGRGCHARMGEQGGGQVVADACAWLGGGGAALGVLRCCLRTQGSYEAIEARGWMPVCLLMSRAGHACHRPPPTGDPPWHPKRRAACLRKGPTPQPRSSTRESAVSLMGGGDGGAIRVGVSGGCSVSDGGWAPGTGLWRARVGMRSWLGHHGSYRRGG
jgi:hypothetical protein